MFKLWNFMNIFGTTMRKIEISTYMLVIGSLIGEIVVNNISVM